MAAPFSKSIILEGWSSWEWMDLGSFWLKHTSFYQDSSKAYFDYTKKAHFINFLIRVPTFYAILQLWRPKIDNALHFFWTLRHDLFIKWKWKAHVSVILVVDFHDCNPMLCPVCCHFNVFKWKNVMFYVLENSSIEETKNYCCEFIHIIYRWKALDARQPKIVTFFASRLMMRIIGHNVWNRHS